MNVIVKAFKHFHTVNKHRFYVFIYSIKAGIPFRGLVHDLSKYSPTEFFESVKYFDGHKSPIHFAKLDKGYSNAWLHHKGMNKHHFEYWEDVNKDGKFGAFIPYKYAVESICDKLAAGKVYTGKNFNKEQPLKYWNNVDNNGLIKIHPGIIEFTDTVLTKISKVGINDTLKPSYLKKTYNEIYNKYFNK